MYIADKGYGSRYDTAQFNAALHASYAEQERLFATYPAVVGRGRHHRKGGVNTVSYTA